MILLEILIREQEGVVGVEIVQEDTNHTQEEKKVAQEVLSIFGVQVVLGVPILPEPTTTGKDTHANN